MSSTAEPKRFTQVIELRKDHEEEYLKLHAEVWPTVLAGLRRAHIEDYSISILPVPPYKPSSDDISALLIASFKYTGTDFESDMKALAADPETQRWWAVTDPMQKSLIPGATGSKDGEWWLNLTEVFRLEK